MKRAAAVSWSERHVGVPLSVASQDLSLSQQELRRLLGKRVKFHLGDAKPRKTSSATPDEVLLSALREFYEETGETAAQSFTQWSRSHGVPTHQTVANRFGGWNAALERAGIAVTDRRRSRSKYSDAELVEALVDAWSSATPPRTYLELSDWLSARPGMPSAALIRNRLGVGFEEMRARALRVVAGQSMGFPGRKRTPGRLEGQARSGGRPADPGAPGDRGPRAAPDRRRLQQLGGGTRSPRHADGPAPRWHQLGPARGGGRRYPQPAEARQPLHYRGTPGVDGAVHDRVGHPQPVRSRGVAPGPRWPFGSDDHHPSWPVARGPRKSRRGPTRGLNRR